MATADVYLLKRHIYMLPGMMNAHRHTYRAQRRHAIMMKVRNITSNDVERMHMHTGILLDYIVFVQQPSSMTI